MRAVLGKFMSIKNIFPKVKTKVVLLSTLVAVLLFAFYRKFYDNSLTLDIVSHEVQELQPKISFANLNDSNVVASKGGSLVSRQVGGVTNQLAESRDFSDVLENKKQNTAASYFKKTKTSSQVVDAEKLVAQLKPKGEIEFNEMISELTKSENTAIQLLDGDGGKISAMIRQMCSGKFKNKTHMVSAFFSELSGVPVNLKMSMVNGYDVYIRYNRDGAVLICVINNRPAGTEYSLEFYDSGMVRSFVYSRMNLDKTGLDRSLDFMVSETGELVRDDADP